MIYFIGFLILLGFFFDSLLGIFLFLAIAVFLFVIAYEAYGDDRKCAWCDRGDNMTLIKGATVDNIIWDYSNLDGSRDNRVRENIGRSEYISQYKCIYCDSLTEFLHEADIDPSPHTPVLSRKLVKKGNKDLGRWGSRVGDDKNR